LQVAIEKQTNRNGKTNERGEVRYESGIQRAQPKIDVSSRGNSPLNYPFLLVCTYPYPTQDKVNIFIILSL